MLCAFMYFKYIWKAIQMNVIVCITLKPEEETKERATLVTDISNYLNTTKAQFITGELDIDADWDEHLKKLKEMGLEK